MKIQFTQKETAALKALKEQLYTLKNTVSSLFGKKYKYKKPDELSEFNKNGVVIKSIDEELSIDINEKLSIAFIEYVGDLANHYAAGIMTIIPAATMWIKGYEGIIEDGIKNFEDVIVEINDEKERSKDAQQT